MKKYLKKFFNDQHGSIIEIYPIMLTLFIGVAIIINLLLPCIIVYFDIQEYANNVKRDIEICGGIDDSVLHNINMYNNNIITPDKLDYSESDFIYGTKKINLADKVVVQASKQVTIDFYIFTEKINIKSSKYYGRSEVYWKE